MYKLTGINAVIRRSDGAYIPEDDANSDYQQYQLWLAEGNTPEPVDPPSSEQLYAKWKADRQAKVDAITVEVDGMVFDGDEISQGRMARAVTAADQLTDTTPWTLHDNSVVTVTALQLKTACRLAGEAQTLIWNDGRQA